MRHVNRKWNYKHEKIGEIQQAFKDYQLTQFGGWPWPSHEHTHPKESGRFARYGDDREEIKE